MSALIITLILIGVAVVGGAIIAAIVLSSGDDASDAAEGAANIGGTATYDDECRFSGTPIAVLRGFSASSLNSNSSDVTEAERNAGALTADAMGGSTAPDVLGMVAQIRLLAGGDELSESAHGADFAGDGFRDDSIPARADNPDFRIGFYAGDIGGTAPNSGAIATTDAAQNIVIPRADWIGLGLTTVGDPADTANVRQNNNDVQVFVNRSRGCWGLRRT